MPLLTWCWWWFQVPPWKWASPCTCWASVPFLKSKWYKVFNPIAESLPHARSLTRALGGLGKRVGVMWWLFACRPARGGGSHYVRAEHQLAVRGPNGISDLLMLYVFRPPTPLVTRALERGSRRAGLGHNFDLVFMSRLRMFAVTGPPVEVGVTMYVLSISSVSEVLMVLIATSN